MSVYKMTFFFNDTIDNVGWTENWWTNASTATAAINLMVNYGTVRSGILLDTTLITNVRAANVDHPRDSLLASTGFPYVGTIPRATYPQAGVWDCLLCRRDISTNDLLGHMFLHQVPAGIFSGRVYTPAAVSALGWVAKFNLFVTEVTGGAYQLRKHTPGVYTYSGCNVFEGIRRTERRLGRPLDALRGRRVVA